MHVLGTCPYLADMGEGFHSLQMCLITEKSNMLKSPDQCTFNTEIVMS